MSQCNSIDHIAEDHIHTDIAWNIEEPQQKYRLGAVENRLLGRGGDLNMFYRIRTQYSQYFFNSPEPKASGELIGWEASVFRPSVVRPSSVHTFKRLLL